MLYTCMCVCSVYKNNMTLAIFRTNECHGSECVISVYCRSLYIQFVCVISL